MPEANRNQPPHARLLSGMAIGVHSQPSDVEAANRNERMVASFNDRSAAAVDVKTNMKKLSLLTAVALLLALPALAESGGKEITIKGEGQCAKCSLKEGDKCQNVVVTEKNGKKTTYYLADNDVSKNFHAEVCKAPKAVSVTGVCKKVDSKLVVTASKIQ
jgi:hypothetical protein